MSNNKEQIDYGKAIHGICLECKKKILPHQIICDACLDKRFAELGRSIVETMEKVKHGRR